MNLSPVTKPNASNIPNLDQLLHMVWDIKRDNPLIDAFLPISERDEEIIAALRSFVPNQLFPDNNIKKDDLIFLIGVTADGIEDKIEELESSWHIVSGAVILSNENNHLGCGLKYSCLVSDSNGNVAKMYDRQHYLKIVK